MTKMTRDDINKRIALSFFNNKEKVHISRKRRSNETVNPFRNGIITRVDKEFFIIDDEINGKETIFYFELKKEIEAYIPRSSNK
jgi:hypothetical protein